MRSILMRRALLLLAIAGCSTHHTLTAGPTLGIRGNTTTGGELTGEAAAGDEGGLMVVAAATGRLGHDLSGVALRTGLALNKGPRPWGGKLSLSLGPSFIDDGNGGREARFEARGALAVFYGFIHKDDPDEGMFKRTTLGVELFASTIGIDNNELLVGLGVTFGSYHGSAVSALAAYRPAD